MLCAIANQAPSAVKFCSAPNFPLRMCNPLPEVAVTTPFEEVVHDLSLLSVCKPLLGNVLLSEGPQIFELSKDLWQSFVAPFCQVP